MPLSPLQRTAQPQPTGRTAEKSIYIPSSPEDEEEENLPIALLPSLDSFDSISLATSSRIINAIPEFLTLEAQEKELKAAERILKALRRKEEALRAEIRGVQNEITYSTHLIESGTRKSDISSLTRHHDSLTRHLTTLNHSLRQLAETLRQTHSESTRLHHIQHCLHSLFETTFQHSQNDFPIEFSLRMDTRDAELRNDIERAAVLKKRLDKERRRIFKWAIIKHSSSQSAQSAPSSSHTAYVEDFPPNDFDNDELPPPYETLERRHSTGSDIVTPDERSLRRRSSTGSNHRQQTHNSNSTRERTRTRRRPLLIDIIPPNSHTSPTAIRAQEREERFARRGPLDFRDRTGWRSGMGYVDYGGGYDAGCDSGGGWGGDYGGGGC